METATISVHRTYSPHDGGWYVEVCDDSGAELYVTRVWPRSESADREALRWIEKHHPGAVVVRI